MAVLYVKDADGNITPIPSIKGETGPQGPKGDAGEAGVNGYTPVKGIDYWTEDDLASIQNDSYAYISEELAKRGQLKPEFANSIEECIDTTKLYVLPDGYIYAYTKITETQKNNILSDVGFTENTRINSSYAEATWSGVDLSGYIKVNTGDIIYLDNITMPDNFSGTGYGGRVIFYDENKNGITAPYMYAGQYEAIYGEDGNLKQFKIPSNILTSETGYIRINADNIDDNSFIAVNEQIVTSEKWTNTGHAFIPTDYEERIIELEKETVDHEARLKILEAKEGEIGVPEYWLSELETKANAIQVAMETAGRNKSAFLWYTDAHWQTNSKISPVLLNYLAKNTPINKVNFGGDVINDPAEFTHNNTKYAYEWRKLISDLPNHHSVYGNHDVNHRTTDVNNMSYALLLADEETSDMVVGGDSYYYIDNPSEKTRYLYLSYLTSNSDEMIAQGQFIVDAITSAQDGWHIVAIAHRWFQYTASSAPTVGSIPTYENEILNIFDEYNARSTHAASNYFYEQDFSDCKGKVEFCIGGHIHVDYDFTSTGGIPVIITASDTNQERSSDETEDSGTVGTITESAVFGIIADYTNNKITIVGIGRGTSREINY